MTDLLTKVRTTYQAPISGSRIRYRKADAYADWAYALVRRCLKERCECCPGDNVTPGEVCGGHMGRKVPVLEPYYGDTGDTKLVYTGIFNEDVRRGMRRRLTKMLRAGWRPQSVGD